MTQGFSYHAEQEEGILILHLRGDLTRESEDTFKNINLEEQTGEIIIDFSAVPYINSAGLAQLIGLVRRYRKNGGNLCAVNLSEHYKKIFYMVGLSDYIAVFDTLEQARQVLKSNNDPAGHKL